MAAMVHMQLSLRAAFVEKDPEDHLAHLERGLALLEPGPTLGHTILLGNLASALLDRGEVQRAADALRQSIIVNLEGRSLRFLINELRLAGEIATTSGRPYLAARLVGASIALGERLGTMEEWFNESSIDAQVHVLKSALGEDEFASAVAAGRIWPLDDALDEVLRLLDEITKPQG
jgi:hypothetical protein